MCSAGLHVAARKRSENIDDPHLLFGQLHSTIQSSTFSNIEKIASDERIDDLESPSKMRKMQKVAVEDLTKTDSLRKKVSCVIYTCSYVVLTP